MAIYANQITNQITSGITSQVARAPHDAAVRPALENVFTAHAGSSVDTFDPSAEDTE